MLDSPFNHLFLRSTPDHQTWAVMHNCCTDPSINITGMLWDPDPTSLIIRLRTFTPFLLKGTEAWDFSTLFFFHESTGLGVWLKCPYSVFRFLVIFGELLANSVDSWKKVQKSHKISNKSLYYAIFGVTYFSYAPLILDSYSFFRPKYLMLLSL